MTTVKKILKPTSIKMIIFVFALFIMLYSCSKDQQQQGSSLTNIKKIADSTSNISDTFNFRLTQNFIYSGTTYTVASHFNHNENKLEFDNMPQVLIDYYSDSTKTESVTHVLVYDDRNDIYLFDNPKDHNQAFVFENANPNRHKGFNEAQSKSYATANKFGQLVISFSGLLRTINNTVWKSFDFGSCNAYGLSIPWVGSSENDNIEGYTLLKNTGSERPHIMSCEHANWGGKRLYITMVSNVNYAKQVWVGAWPMKYRWWTLSWVFWHNEISSYEMFQTNVKLYGNTI
jgi:hypothetical protein